jgi:hypothetical protein
MQMLMASRLTDGRVVFLTDGNGWTESIDAGAIARTREAGAALLETAERSVRASAVVDPYLIEVIEREGRLRPAVLREAIRALGPSVSTAARSDWS